MEIKRFLFIVILRVKGLEKIYFIIDVRVLLTFGHAKTRVFEFIFLDRVSRQIILQVWRSSLFEVISF